MDVSELARIISKVIATKVTYHDLPSEQYARVVQQTGLDKATAASSPPWTPRSPTATSKPAAGAWRTCWAALPHPWPKSCARYDPPKVTFKTAVIRLIGADRIGGTVARLAIDAGYHVLLSKQPRTRNPQRPGPAAR